MDHVFLASALVGDKWLASSHDCFTLLKVAHCLPWIGGCVGPRACLDALRNNELLPLAGLEQRQLGAPACSHFLAFNFIYNYRFVIKYQ
jgi:hypothetical protein